MSQSELSRVTGVSRSYIAEIEKGTKQPRMLVARALATALEVDLDDLLS
jgi:transcriptional regulator with XRE-family HTH domain